MQMTNSLEAQGNSHSPVILCLLIFKILTRLTVYGWGGHVSTAEGRAAFVATQAEFFQTSINDLVSLAQIRKERLSAGQQNASQKHGIENVNKLVKNLSKFHRMLLLQNHHVFHELGQSQRLIELGWTFVSEASQDLTQLVSGEIALSSMQRNMICDINLTIQPKILSHYIQKPS
jgi:hypothetical protein